MRQMRIAVVSDSHNNRTYTARAAAIIAECGIDTVIHCGDVTGPDVLREVFAGFTLHVVLGNVDRDRAAIEAAVPELPPGSTAGEVYETTFDAVPIAAVHGHTPKLSELVASGAYGFLFHGHTHRRRDERVGTTRVVNPGALGGLKRETRSFCLVDPGAGRVEFIELAD